MFQKTGSLLILVLLFLMIGDEAKGEENKNTPASVKNQIKFVPHSGDEKQIKIKVKMEDGGKTGTTFIGQTKPSDDRYRGYILNFDDHPINFTFAIESTSALEVLPPEIGTVLLKGNDHEDVFFETGGGGSGSFYTVLNLFCPKYLEVMELSMSFNHDEFAYPIPEVSRSENFSNKNLSNEKKFLEKVKFEEGYSDESDLDLKDPHYAVYIWKKNNGKVEDGKISIKKYKTPVMDSKVIKKLKIGDRIYFAREHKGIDVHDAKTDEYYILYYKDYKWFDPTVLKNTGPFLIVGSNEGLFIFNTKNSHLKKYWKGFEEGVEKVDILPSKIVVNGKVEIDFPKF